MDIFSNATLREARTRFQSPRIKTVHHIEILYADFSVDYLVDEKLTLSSSRDDAMTFESDEMDTAGALYTLLCLKGLDASIETCQRTVN